MDRREYEEKRDHRRLALDCPMRFTTVADGAAHEGVARDISATGLLFECDVALPTGAELAVSVCPPGAVVAPFEAVVTVVRATPLGGGRFEVGTAVQTLTR